MSDGAWILVMDLSYALVQVGLLILAGDVAVLARGETLHGARLSAQ